MLPSAFGTDHLDLVRLLGKHDVDFVLVGGVAVNYHGYSRTTGDIDLYYRRTADNVARLYAGLAEFFGGVVPVIRDAAELLEPGLILQFGVPPNRVDLLNEISGVDFESVWANRIVESIEGEDAALPIIHIDQLLANKRAAGRAKDQDDYEYLATVAKEIAEDD